MLRADEAALADGKPVVGSLTLDKTGLQFTPAAPGRAVALADVTEFRLAAAAPPPFRAGPGMRLVLPGGQSLTGVFLGLKDDALLFRTAWADRLRVPRAAPTALRHLPGWRPVLVADLHTRPAGGGATTGGPAFGRAGLVLDKAGQSLRLPLAPAVAAGRIGVTFVEKAETAGGRWQVEAAFGEKDKERLLRVTVAGGDAPAVDAGGLPGTAQKVGRVAGPRRLVVRFTAGSLSVLCDDAVLWYTLKSGPGGPLRRVSLACVRPDRAPAVRGGVAFTDLVVERAAAEKRRPPAEPDQDELWLAGGDQLFGAVVAADAQGVQIRTRFGPRRLAWTALRGWFLKRQPGPVRPPAGGPAVRLWLRSGLRAELDLLEGALTAMDARQLTLRHAQLGEVRIPRSCVARLRPLHAGG
jgi:hypothetical protein